MDKIIPPQSTPNGASQVSNSLASAVLEALAPCGNSFFSDPGQVLFSTGERPTRLLILLEGNVKLSIDSEDGRTLILEIAGAHELLGLSSVIAGEPYDKNATTLTLCRLVSVNAPDFDALLRSSSRISQLALSELNKCYKRACSQVQRLGEPYISVRLARVLLQWARQGRRTERGLRFHIPLNHNEIGEYIGARRETVTRLLSEFQRRGLIEVKGALLTVEDPHLLETIVGFPATGSNDLA